MRTPVCDLLEIDVPVIQAAIGGVTCPELAAAVSNAGGLGTIGMAGRGADGARNTIERTRELSNRSFAVNFILDFDCEKELATSLEAGVSLVSLFWGDPTPLVARIHEHGAKVMMSIGSVEEAKRAADAGVDVVVAQGWEAGGHVRGNTATLALVPRVVDAVSPLPVVAAGGIADGRGLAAVLALGAQAAWIGTRFLAATEADAHPEYRKRIFGAEASDTYYSALFDVGWPGAPGRVIRNSTVEAWEQAGKPSKERRPGLTDLLAATPDGEQARRYEAMTARSDFDG
ncbi:MAG: nitronate monooxygenase, partial [Salaquimonas sp.]|nr:nitronate monooxygenase [Salaquimonas sp.]